jgi:hypothetical protein
MCACFSLSAPISTQKTTYVDTHRPRASTPLPSRSLSFAHPVTLIVPCVISQEGHEPLHLCIRRHPCGRELSAMPASQFAANPTSDPSASSSFFHVFQGSPSGDSSRPTGTARCVDLAGKSLTAQGDRDGGGGGERERGARRGDGMKTEGGAVRIRAGWTQE